MFVSYKSMKGGGKGIYIILGIVKGFGESC
jgi:hypothetical protein